MTDRGEVALVFGVLELDLFFSQPVPINRPNELLVFLQQPLAEFLNFLFVHLCSSLQKPSWFCNREMGVYASWSPCQLASDFDSCDSNKVSTRTSRSQTHFSKHHPEQVFCQSQRVFRTSRTDVDRSLLSSESPTVMP